MKNNFIIAYEFTNALEGGYVNDRTDRGGETFNGISRNNFPNWGGWKIIDSYKGRSGFPMILERVGALQDLHKQFFYKEFWKKIKGDYLPYDIAIKVYDMAVNLGVKTAVKILQRATNVIRKTQITTDGIIGNQTINAVQDCREDVLLKLLNILQGMRYVNIIESNHSQKKFINGWIANRIS